MRLARKVLVSVARGRLRLRRRVGGALPAARRGERRRGARAARPGAHAKDVVTAILADFRGLDTLGEITVVALVLLGVGTLLNRDGSPVDAARRLPGARDASRRYAAS